MELFERIAGIILPVFMVIAIGYLYARLRGNAVKTDMVAVNRVTTEVLAPLLIFTALANKNFDLAHNATLANPTNSQPGDSGVITITQDAAGNRTMAFDTDWKFSGGDPTLSTAAGAVDVLVYYVAAAGVIIANLLKGFA